MNCYSLGEFEYGSESVDEFYTALSTQEHDHTELREQWKLLFGDGLPSPATRSTVKEYQKQVEVIKKFLF